MCMDVYVPGSVLERFLASAARQTGKDVRSPLQEPPWSTTYQSTGRGGTHNRAWPHGLAPIIRRAAREAPDAVAVGGLVVTTGDVVPGGMMWLVWPAPAGRRLLREGPYAACRERDG